MKPDAPLLSLRLLATVALGVCVMLLWDYIHPLPAFCSAGSGCATIRAKYGAPFGIPVPGIGFGAFAGLFVATCIPRARRVAGVLALVGGVVGLGLIVSQVFVLKTVCWMCMTVDGAAVLSALAGAAVLRTQPGRDVLTWLGDTGLVALAVLVPLSLTEARPPEKVPSRVLELQSPDVVTIVEFSDFECPYCRRAHPAIEAARHEAGVPTKLVRRTFPLPGHPNARFASRAWLCAEKQGKGDAMADRLYGSDDISKDGCARIAGELGLDTAAYSACVGSSSTEAMIEDHIQLIRASQFRGLPTVWIGDQLVLGAESKGTYLNAIRAVAAGKRAEGRLWPLAAALLLGATLLLFGRKAEA